MEKSENLSTDQRQLKNNCTTPPRLKAHLVEPDVHPPLSPSDARAMPAGVAHPAEGREPAGHEGSAGVQGWGSAPAPLPGAPPLLCKGINFPATLGWVWPPLCHQPHNASRLLCPTCCPAQPQPHSTAGSRGSQALPGPPSPPALPCLCLDNFFTCFIYEDSPPSANTLSFLLLWSGRPNLLFFSYYFSLSPLQGPQARQPGPASDSPAVGAGRSAPLFGHGSRRGERLQVGCAVIPPQPPCGTQPCLRLPQLLTLRLKN